MSSSAKGLPDSKERPPSNGSPGADDLPSPISILREIQGGELLPSSLSQNARMTCVEHLTVEGYSVGEIAELLKVSPRTVHRDRDRYRQANALRRDPVLIEQMVGDLVHQAQHSIQRLRRIARERECPADVRVEAERGAWQVVKESTELLQRLGYLPTAPQEVRADLTHRLAEAPSWPDLHGQVIDLEAVVKEVAGVDDTLKAELGNIEDELRRRVVGDSVAAVAKRVKEPGGSGEDHDAEGGRRELR